MTAAGDAPWFHAVLGGQLARWDGGQDYTLVPAEEVLADVETLGLYFPPLLGDDLAERLAEFHEQVNEAAGRARLRVVQVLTPQQHVHVHVPWFAVPPDDYDRQRRVCGRYRVRADVALSCLVLVDGRTGRLVTRSGRERLLADPRGLAFPWPARPLHQVLAAASLQHRDADLRLEDLKRKDLVIGLYFSAHWCPPCKAFTPQLISSYNALRARGHNFEVVFVSSDRSEESFLQYARSMPWPAVSWSEAAARQELAALLAVQAIPTLVLLDQDGSLITDDARASVTDDPEGKDFPWRPEPVSVFTERLSGRLHDHPALILFVEGGAGEVEWAVGVLEKAAEVYAERYPADSQAGEPRLQFYVAPDGDAADSLREQLVLEDAVPLLVAVDVWRGAVSVLEDEEDEAAPTVSVASAVTFMEAFLAGELPSAPIGVHLLRPHLHLDEQHELAAST